MSLAAHRLGLRAGRRTLVDSLDLVLEPGEVLGILGPNGAGKSTLLTVLAGLALPARGDVTLDGQAVADLPPLTRAQHIGLLPQGDEDTFFGSVADFVALGHFPFAATQDKPFATAQDKPFATAQDKPFATAQDKPFDTAQDKPFDTAQDKPFGKESWLATSLAAWELADLAHRPLATLSGGERQRARLAQLSAQRARIVLLDEPLTHLDPAHQARLLEWARSEADAKKAVALTLHDPGWAARQCNRLLFLHGDGGWKLGPPADLLTSTALEALYGPGTAALWRKNGLSEPV